LNKTCFNMGYHNEHHDFAGVPWNNLPKLRSVAPEYYDSLKSYGSWTAVLLKFIFDPSMSTYSRVVRASQQRAQRRAQAAPDRTRAEARSQDAGGRDGSILEPSVGAGRTPASTGAH
jgi:sphingolipid delta-4 desaturase